MQSIIYNKQLIIMYKKTNDLKLILSKIYIQQSALLSRSILDPLFPAAVSVIYSYLSMPAIS